MESDNISQFPSQHAYARPTNTMIGNNPASQSSYPSDGANDSSTSTGVLNWKTDSSASSPNKRLVMPGTEPSSAEYRSGVVKMKPESRQQSPQLVEDNLGLSETSQSMNPCKVEAPLPLLAAGQTRSANEHWEVESGTASSGIGSNVTNFPNVQKSENLSSCSFNSNPIGQSSGDAYLNPNDNSLNQNFGRNSGPKLGQDDFDSKCSGQYPISQPYFDSSLNSNASNDCSLPASDQSMCRQQGDPMDLGIPSHVDLERLSATSSQVSSGVGSMTSSNAGSGCTGGGGSGGGGSGSCTRGPSASRMNQHTNSIAKRTTMFAGLARSKLESHQLWKSGLIDPDTAGSTHPNMAFGFGTNPATGLASSLFTPGSNFHSAAGQRSQVSCYTPTCRPHSAEHPGFTMRSNLCTTTLNPNDWDNGTTLGRTMGSQVTRNPLGFPTAPGQMQYDHGADEFGRSKCEFPMNQENKSQVDQRRDQWAASQGATPNDWSQSYVQSSTDPRSQISDLSWMNKTTPNPMSPHEGQQRPGQHVYYPHANSYSSPGSLCGSTFASGRSGLRSESQGGHARSDCNTDNFGTNNSAISHNPNTVYRSATMMTDSDVPIYNQPHPWRSHNSNLSGNNNNSSSNNNDANNNHLNMANRDTTTHYPNDSVCFPQYQSTNPTGGGMNMQSMAGTYNPSTPTTSSDGATSDSAGQFGFHSFNQLASSTRSAGTMAGSGPMHHQQHQHHHPHHQQQHSHPGIQSPSMQQPSMFSGSGSVNSSNPLLYSPFLQSIFEENPPSAGLNFLAGGDPISGNLVVCSMPSMDTDCVPFRTYN